MLTKNADRMALLALSDESVFYGYSKGYNGEGVLADNIYSVGEVVFNTAITGYQEILTDPSYHSQIINFTHPHIGNTGVNPLDEESDAAFASGIIARDISSHYSSWRAVQSLPAYLTAHKILAVDGVDTRAITCRLRRDGALNGCLMVLAEGEDAAVASKAALARACAFAGLSGALLAASASSSQASEGSSGEWRQESNDYAAAGRCHHRVTVLDCGAKRNILRALTERGCRVRLLPYDADYQTIKDTQPHGVLFSNGPGDPAPCENAHRLAKQLLADGVPLFGLCLGHQIIAAALGAKTEKMKFGHHGANHPVQAIDDGRVLITSQNHGFAVRADTLPPQVRITHRSLFDGSLQGIAGDNPSFMTFQGHPEASPGPKDAAVLFDRFIQLMERREAVRAQT